MIRISALTLTRGTRVLLDGADLVVHPGQRVGLVGPNGCGKSTLFALLRGELTADRGDVAIPPRWTLAHVAQETPPSDASALDYVLDGDAELREIEGALAAAEADAGFAGEALAELHHRFEAIQGYSARARAAMLLDGLGFPASDHGRPVREFSGGWRMRLNLAQALMTRSDLLLLDEPTNHLDLDAVLWLEDWLSSYPGTLILITHDRDFLDAIVSVIVHVDQKKLRSYTGNYAAFETTRASELALQQANFDAQQRRIAHLQSYIDRFRAKATKARQAQSRIKALERMERIAAAHVDSPFNFRFEDPVRSPKQLVVFEQADLGYAGVDGAPVRSVLSGVNFSLLGGQRIGLLGPNGAGKSTLVKAMATASTLLAGKRNEGYGLVVGYFAQHQVEQLRADESPLWHLNRLDSSVREQELRDFLGGFDFRGDMATAPVGRFSGGERARLTLALLVFQRPNLLLLDEPTNHLDIEMREALTEALQDYTGALVVVAHDRHLLRATTDELWLVDGGRVGPFDGDLDDYRDWVLARKRAARESERNAGARSDALPTDRKAQRRADAEERQRRAQMKKPLQQKLVRIEKELAALNREKAEIDRWLTSPEAYADTERTRLAQSTRRQGEVSARIAVLETEWLEGHDELERFA